ncbi:MAG: polyhydroxyalkanoate biosynthesis repressor PhaR [Elusimicrobia bacterium CG1_02_63_36]|nr:MAG: polyhydroxyalkanoate biosynthesis repressor PhaR [Elusimicrobia bacterium CG1_02_63_36]PIP83023.1 MAG: KpsF/GutQ family sugar-phosphate isomerase [Elusimicrobia bacterium CG22_combo_CG10-13_8_21_14_all_63_91]PJA17516.1 MAG: KpsF/GutQ family sugar-phosphate isomerase [Elusimicrobia bacterium CG_4_10_14_0_2_um_filter_63_34]PJB25411.1 MAG: KpsF/GutQ family sugar-phosphate isomerase [Elusimicrobia bacterium CG_4_9_14_3_um_filter_62_55]
MVARSIRSVIELEARTLEDVRNAVDASYTHAVKLLLSCRGKVIVTGTGKSGLIAKKLAATFSSTGTPALYLHPTDGIHGDLGLVERKDLVIAIGKSGESLELTSIIPTLKRLRVKLIAITAAPKSALAKKADVCLNTPIRKEACPLNLAPTASTTAALAVGDALAVTLMKLRGFKREHFALLHPGGQLGKRLTLKVSDIMRGGEDNPTVRAGIPVSKMLVEITRKQAGAVNVVDVAGKLVGLVTDFDIRRALEAALDLRTLTVRAVMNPKPARILNTRPAYEAVDLMQNRERPFNVLPVVDKAGRSVGMVQIHDLRNRGL